MFVCKPVRAVPGPRAVGQAQVSLSSPHMPGLEPTSDTVTVSRTHAVQLADSVRWSQSQEPKQKSPACETETSTTNWAWDIFGDYVQSNWVRGCAVLKSITLYSHT